MKIIFIAFIVLQIFVQIHMSENVIEQVKFRQKNCFIYQVLRKEL